MKYEIRNTRYELLSNLARYFSASLLLLLLANIPAAHAAWYQVEVIVFEQLRPNLEGEVWFENPGLPSRSDSINPITSVPDNISQVKMNGDDQEQTGDDGKLLIPYLELSNDALRLQRDFRILKLSADYRPLLHLAWQQPGYDDDSGRAVHLEKLVDSAAPEQQLPPELARNQIEDDTYQAPEPVIDGTIRLRATRFLHVDVDIAYFPSHFLQTLRQQRQDAGNPGQLTVNPNADYVRLRESRKIKLNELHYFDNPLFGVLLQVTRVKE